MVAFISIAEQKMRLRGVAIFRINNFKIYKIRQTLTSSLLIDGDAEEEELLLEESDESLLLRFFCFLLAFLPLSISKEPTGAGSVVSVTSDKNSTKHFLSRRLLSMISSSSSLSIVISSSSDSLDSAALESSFDFKSPRDPPFTRLSAL